MLQESRIDDDWNVDGIEVYQIQGIGLTNSKQKKNLSGYMWSRERRTKIQATARPNYLWPENWSGMSNSSAQEGKGSMGHGETQAR